MTRDLTPRWWDTMPERLEQGVLYISVEYATTAHLCACGCGSEVVTPLSPHNWRLIYDGTVSLTPSIGNWSFPCRSHYWIRSNRIVWADTWSDEEVAQARRRNQGRASAAAPDAASRAEEATTPSVRGWLRRLLS
jgi:hypothetical protein